MPIFKYYNPYRRPNFYNYYRTPIYNTNYPQNTIPESSPNNVSKYSPTYTPNNIPQPPHISKSEETSSHRQNRSKPKSDDNVWLDLFGIKLYFDDVLILSLLFFLYKEEVKDEGLFLALVLLLIS